MSNFTKIGKDLINFDLVVKVDPAPDPEDGATLIFSKHTGLEPILITLPYREIVKALTRTNSTVELEDISRKLGWLEYLDPIKQFMFDISRNQTDHADNLEKIADQLESLVHVAENKIND